MRGMRLADWVIEFLERHVDVVFTVSGGGSIFLCDALAQAKTLKYVCCHHEQACAMAAEAYARVTGKIGVCIVTSGPGGTNAVTGCAGAWTDHVPVLFISGQAFLKHTITAHPGMRQLGVQEINIVDIVRPITKYAVMVEHAQNIRFCLEQAWFLAKAGRPSPAWLDIPGDIQNAIIDPATLDGFTPPERAAPSIADEVSRIVERLIFAKRPLIHIGQGVRLSGAIEAFNALIDKWQIPFVTARNANDIAPWDHPLLVGRPGTFAQRGANFAVQTCDLYIAIGTRLALTQTGYNSKDYARNAKIVHVDIDAAELGKDMLRDPITIRADAKQFIEEFDRQLSNIIKPEGQWAHWVQRCAVLKARYPVVLPEYSVQKGTINSYYFVERLSELLTPNEIIVTDMGFAFQNMHQAFKNKAGQRFFTNSGLAPMGWGLPAAIGAFVGSKRHTICITGDGGIMMNLQELATIAHYRFPIKIFVLNNLGYATIRQTQELGFAGRIMGADAETGISFPNFRFLATAFEIPPLRIRTHEGLDKLPDFLATPGPALCEIMLHPKQIQAPRAVNRRNDDGTMNPTSLEDAWPYLPREIIEQEMVI